MMIKSFDIEVESESKKSKVLTQQDYLLARAENAVPCSLQS